MLVKVHDKCASCGKSACKKCTRCQTHVYCGKNCQKKDWPKHSKICKDLQTEMVVERAAALIKKLYLSFREHTFDNEILEVSRMDNGDIMIHDSGLETKTKWFTPFPNELVDATMKNSVLTALMCNEPLAVMKPVLAQVFRECQVRMDENEVHLDRPLFSVYVQKSDGDLVSTKTFNHSVLSITSLLSGREWVVDLVGDQFGVSDAGWRWDAYKTKYAARVLKINKFGTNQDLTGVLSEIQGIPVMTHRVAMELATAFNESIRAWEKKEALKLYEVVKMPAEEYEKKCGELVEASKTFMAEFMATLDVSREFNACMAYERANPGLSGHQTFAKTFEFFKDK